MRFYPILQKKTEASAAVRIVNQEIAGGTPIRTIISGPTGREDSNKA